MKRHVLPVFCVALVLSGKLASEADAQSARAKAHTEAARALAYEPGQDFTGAFDAVCVAPRSCLRLCQPASSHGRPLRALSGMQSR